MSRKISEAKGADHYRAKEPYEEAGVRQVIPTEVVPGVYQLGARGAKVTAIVNDDEVVLVDVGARGSLRRIAAGLTAIGSSLDRVRLVALTHYHPDHTGGLAEVVEATSARVAAHSREAGIISGREPAPSPFVNRIVAGVARPFISLFHGGPVEVDYLLNDGDPLPLARDPARIVHTPGHTPGSICLHIPSKKLLIAGDAMEYRSGRLLPPAASVTRDPALAMESLVKLLALDFDIICFSHFPPLAKGARETLQQLLQER